MTTAEESALETIKEQLEGMEKRFEDELKEVRDRLKEVETGLGDHADQLQDLNRRMDQFWKTEWPRHCEDVTKTRELVERLVLKLIPQVPPSTPPAPVDDDARTDLKARLADRATRVVERVVNPSPSMLAALVLLAVILNRLDGSHLLQLVASYVPDLPVVGDDSGAP